MEITAIDQEMYNYFVQLKDAEKKSVVQLIKTFLQERDQDGETNIEQYNREIDEAEAEIERGESFSQEQVTQMSKGWLHGR